ncbi:hypothetical protein VCHA52P455_40200 [Vibrio chagasii]|nr:hypothetical protein VCHA52P455_40200 [Vibrio chagasii]
MSQIQKKPLNGDFPKLEKTYQKLRQPSTAIFIVANHQLTGIAFKL